MKIKNNFAFLLAGAAVAVSVGICRADRGDFVQTDAPTPEQKCAQIKEMESNLQNACVVQLKHMDRLHQLFTPYIKNNFENFSKGKASLIFFNNTLQLDIPIDGIFSIGHEYAEELAAAGFEAVETQGGYILVDKKPLQIVTSADRVKDLRARTVIQSKFVQQALDEALAAYALEIARNRLDTIRANIESGAYQIAHGMAGQQ